MRSAISLVSCLLAIGGSTQAQQLDDGVTVVFGPGTAYGINEAGLMVGTNGVAVRSLPPAKDDDPRIWVALSGVGGTSSEAWGVNVAGDIVGNVQDGGPRAFLWMQNEGYRKLSNLSTWAYDINNMRNVIGRLTSGQQGYMVVWENGILQKQPNGTSQLSGGYGISQNDNYSGWVAPSSTYGLRFVGGARQQLGAYGTRTNHIARRINSQGDAVGRATGSPLLALYWKAGNSTAVLLPPLGGSPDQGFGAEAWDINEAGDEIVGWSHDASGQPKATLWRKFGTWIPIDLNSLDTDRKDTDPILVVAYRINRGHQICGATSDGQSFILDRMPLYKQGDPSWGDSRYVSEDNPNRMRSVGCQLTSVSMVLRYLGIDKGVDGLPVTPGNLNAYLKTVGIQQTPQGFDFLPEHIQAYSGGRVYLAEKGIGQDKDWLFVRSLVDARNPVIFRVRGSTGPAGHFIVGHGCAESSFFVRDPADKDYDENVRKAVRLDDPYYQNTYREYRVWKLSGPSPATATFTISLFGPGEITATDPFGKRAGYKPGGGTYNEISGALYGPEGGWDNIDSGESTASFMMLSLPNTSDGSYQVRVTPMASGSATLVLNATDVSGIYASQPLSLKLQMGQPVVLPVQFDTSNSRNLRAFSQGSLVLSGRYLAASGGGSISVNASSDGSTGNGQLSIVDRTARANVVATSFTTAMFTQDGSAIAGYCSINGVPGGSFNFSSSASNGGVSIQFSVRRSDGSLLFGRSARVIDLLMYIPTKR